MVRPKRSQQNAITPTSIKAAARKQMAENGTAAINLRALARELDITAPAIYNYFPSRDDLLTALIVDAFSALADSMLAAGQAVRSERAAPVIRAIALAYRQWAVTHPVDFELIYGNPIRGYIAPPEATDPLAIKPFLEMFRLFILAWHSGELTIPARYEPVPATIAAHLAGWKAATRIDMPDALIGPIISGWVRIHGMVLLELFGHSQPVIGDPGAFYAYELDAFLTALGMNPSL